MTKLDGGSDFGPKNRSGRNINFGIREFAMASIQNGMLLHGGLRTYVGSFLVFSDYMKSAIRTSALSNLPAIYLFSHDSIAVGEDGPTHEPIEHLAMLRSIPNLTVIRPCDERETYGAWHYALKNTTHPTALILSRQNLTLLENSSSEKVKLGAYDVSNTANPTHIIIATGSEVELALKAKEALDNENISIRVVSMPSNENFLRQDQSYQDELLCVDYSKRISLEMLSTFGWAKFAKHNIGIDTYGLSAPSKDVLKHFGFDTETIINKIKSLIN
jgi:transketolase